jgi:uncharacterized protein YcgL (UPF0745 family)
MLVSIYKSIRKEGAYLYIPKRDDFSGVPEQLLQTFGKPVFVMMVNLQGRELAQVDIDKVRESIEQQGFFLQVPPPVENVLDQFKQQKIKQKK